MSELTNKELRERHDLYSEYGISDTWKGLDASRVVARAKDWHEQRGLLLDRLEAAEKVLEAVRKLHHELIKMMGWEQLGWDIPEEMLEKAHDIQKELAKAGVSNG